ncbi:MAG: ABC transporter permease [Christensenellales bacterium]|jgi:multidrug/hemolysin transport system permease protein
MQVIYNLVIRNLKNYLRDKMTVFFSFLSIIIVLVLYLFFLADMQVDSIMQSISNLPDYLNRENDIEYMVNTWLVAGLLTVNSITMPVIIFSMKVEDRHNKIDYDFNATPAKRYHIVFGYIVSAWIIGIITSVVVFALGEAYILLKGGKLLSIIGILQVLGIITLAVIMFSGMSYLMIMFLTTPSQVGAANTLVGTFSGFLGGIYVPLGLLGTVGTVIKFLPFAHVASLLRQILMQDSIEKVFEGAPPSVADNIKIFYGVNMHIGSYELSALHMILIMLGVIAVFYGLSILIYSKAKRR